MAEAFVLINTEVGGENEVLKALIGIEGVEEAYIVYGVYDVVAKVRAPDIESLKTIVTTNIRKLPKVKSTLTMIVVEGKKLENR
ncbi:MAG: Lrp/AsnC ligand binding domain-containing protein [Desulfurococcales archaeon]|jgi:DNA-binding Lrp family transcriptional regulator|nr:Lrp/AsnC ligand binding domain-containing protein [Desulfurococcales archaeon]